MNEALANKIGRNKEHSSLLGEGMKFYPVFLNLRGKPALVIGGGKVAHRKILSLLKTGARVSAVSSEADYRIKQLHRKGKISWIARNFHNRDLRNKRIVICATNSPELNAKVSRACQMRGIWVNVADAPGLCSFIVPSVVRRGEVTLAISTGGTSPALAKLLRKKAEKLIPPEIAALSKTLKKKRPQLLKLSLRKRRTVIRTHFKTCFRSEIADFQPKPGSQRRTYLTTERYVRGG